MKVLTVYAHPNPQSFNHAVLEEFTKGLKDGGHTFEVVDLYASKFDPCEKLEDLAQFTGGQMPKDVLDQQEKVAAADAMVFIGPVRGWSVPTILKGWLDRVFSHRFAYRFTEKGGAVGLLTHKKALLILTTGFPEQIYRTSGAKDALKKIIIDLSLKMMGVQNAEQVFLYGVSAVDDETRKKYLERAYRLGKEF